MPQKLKFEQIQKDDKASFRYGWTIHPYQDEISLHFHPEMEITHIIKGSGYRMTGDYLEPFDEGEVILCPSNLPHCWIYNPESCTPDGNKECIFVQFLPELLEKGISFFPEWEYTAHRLSMLQQGIRITGETALKAIDILKKMQHDSTSDKLLALIKVIQLIGTTKETIPIGIQSDGFNNITKNMQRMQLVYRYVVEHYKEKISLHDISLIVNMTYTAFCTFFKRETGKTFNSFVNEYRLEIACNLLKNFPDKEISDIAWQCGFNDIPYFNRYFRKEKSMTPSQWRLKS